MLVILKIPIVYIAIVIWWAITAEPEPGELDGVTVLSDTPPTGNAPPRRRANARRPVRPHTPGRGTSSAPAVQRGTVRS